MTIKRFYLPGDEWFYMKIYSGSIIANQLLGDLLYPLLNTIQQKHSITTWFFIRYQDPDDHIRLRFKTSKIENLIKQINELLQNYVDQGIIWRVEVSSYKPEVERYSNKNITICENLFSNESKLIVNFINQNIPTDDKIYIPISLSLVAFYLDIFFMDQQQKVLFLKNQFNILKKHLKVDSSQLKLLNSKYKDMSNSLASININTLAKSNTAISSFVEKQCLLLNQLSNKQSIASDLIHMLVNRLFHSDTIWMEFVVYHHLEKYIKTKNAKSNIKPLT